MMENRQTIYEAHSLYLSGQTLAQVASAMGLKSNSTVLYHFQRHNLPTRKRGGAIKKSQAGAANGNWKGGKVCGKKEYIRIWMPEHHRADKIGYVYEHILIAEQSLKRPLKRGEVVHHINKIKQDNRPNNLMVCTQREHINIHRKGELSCQN